MPRDNPLTYLSTVAVLEFVSFDKRISFFESNGCMMSMTNLSTGKTIDRVIQVPLEDAAEKFALYNLSRKGTHIKRLDMGPGPAFIVNCVPIAIKNLTVRKASESSWFPTVSPIENVKTDCAIREDTFKMAKHVTVLIPGPRAIGVNTEVIAEWNCESIKTDVPMSKEEVADYCIQVLKRTDRPIGSLLTASLRYPTYNAWYNSEMTSSPVERLFDLLQSRMKATKTVLNEEQCATVPIDVSKELNIYNSNENRLNFVIHVNARGTAIDQVV
ncbi:hypothetical protein GCK72_020912 [Caenorhabditis remanei]|uniref:DUF38 domain-containing protein n=1 Tax=Caenorhabditis remanei TaxID=31234 RepID=A0A6A5GII9_CAERE|nr:hypothetical protein GCK72_020912 [Caenorhabditis remanei]KAF1754352.1 hypothetical protein GCK72_020912 [Caenorhabditis remanei]